MSHLSTIISRVKRRVEIEDYDSLFEQAVINLMEYLESWYDVTDKERTEAIELYDKMRPKCSGKGMSSHKRLKYADEIRGNIA